MNSTAKIKIERMLAIFLFATAISGILLQLLKLEYGEPQNLAILVISLYPPILIIFAQRKWINNWRLLAILFVIIPAVLELIAFIILPFQILPTVRRIMLTYGCGLFEVFIGLKTSTVFFVVFGKKLPLKVLFSASILISATTVILAVVFSVCELPETLLQAVSLIFMDCIFLMNIDKISGKSYLFPSSTKNAIKNLCLEDGSVESEDNSMDIYQDEIRSILQKICVFYIDNEYSYEANTLISFLNLFDQIKASPTNIEFCDRNYALSLSVAKILKKYASSFPEEMVFQEKRTMLFFKTVDQLPSNKNEFEYLAQIILNEENKTSELDKADDEELPF